MNRNCWLVLAVGLSAFLGGCSVPVFVKHYKSPDKLEASSLGSLQKIYVIVMRPSQESGVSKFLGSLSKTTELFTGKEVVDENPSSFLSKQDVASLLMFAKGSALALKSAFSDPVAYQLVRSGDDPLWMEKMKFTSSLWIDPKPIVLKKKYFETEYKDKNGEVKKIGRWNIRTTWSVQYRLFKEPERSLVLEEGFSADLSQDFDSEPNLRSFYASQGAKLNEAWQKKLAQDLLPHEVVRTRYLSKPKKDQAMRQAQSAAISQDWPKAREIWQGLVDQNSNHHQAKFNLAIAMEQEGRWLEARRLFEECRLGDKKLAKNADEILRQLDMLVSSNTVLSVASATANLEIFSQPWAVLPMNNQSVDLDGPGHVRAAVEKALIDLGARIIDPQDVDQKLRSQGITDGGQLGSMRPQETGKLLGAPYLLYGTVIDYRVVNLGVYYKAVVSIELRLVDVSNGKEWWRQTEEVTRQGAAPSAKAASTFFLQMADRVIKRTTKTYLNEEVNGAIEQLMASLPHPIRESEIGRLRD